MISKSINLVLGNKVNNSDMLMQDFVQAPDFFFDSINASDVLESQEDEQLLTIMCNKLKSGGMLKISGIDGISLCRKIGNGQVNISELNNLIKSIKQLNSLITMKKFFIDNKWQISSMIQDSNSIRYTIEATKP